METRDELEALLHNLAEALNDLEPGTDKYKELVNQYQKLYDLKTEEAKIDVEFSKVKSEERLRELEAEISREKIKSEEDSKVKETEVTSKQTKNELFGTILRYAVEAGIGIGSLVLYSRCVNKGYSYEYEQNGVYTSQTIRGLIGKLPKIK